MRSTVLVILSLLLLAGGFFVYTRLQPASVARVESRHGVEKAPAFHRGDPALNGMHSGQGAWVLNFDESTGELKSRFRADEYAPQNNGIVKLTRPQAEFYMPNHQRMRLTGVSGEVVVPDAPPASKHSSEQPPPSPPTRGRIHDVTIELFNLFPDAHSDAPDEVIHTNNIQFDNETLLITTEAYTDSAGRAVAPDEVPVRMRGEKYDFDGRGLRMRWNDKDGRLDLLEIAHGEQLVVKDAGAVSGSLGGSSQPRRRIPSPATQPAAPVALGPLPIMLVANGKAATGEALRLGHRTSPQRPASQSGRSKAAAEPMPYVATFFDAVNITQGIEVLVKADRMNVDFITRKGDDGPTTRPADAQGSSNVSRKPTTSVATEAAPLSDSSADPTTQDGTAHVALNPAPATGPAKQPPVVIRWTGKLVMQPPAPNTRPKVSAGDAVVELIGSPVTIRRTPGDQPEGNDIRAARVVYHTADGAVSLYRSDAVPEVVIGKLLNGNLDPRQTITTGTLDYGPDASGKKVAVLSGPGHAMVPMDAGAKSDPAKPPNSGPDMMDARWARGAKAYFNPGGRGQNDLSIEHVDLEGDVDVKHPRLALTSQALSLFFEPAAPPAPTTEPAADQIHPATARSRGRQGGNAQTQLSRVTAHETVHARLTDEKGKQQTIDCTDLELRTARTPDGKAFARNVNARGTVHAYDAEQDLRAELVELTLKPADPAAKRLPQARDGAQPPIPQTQPAESASDTASAELEKMIARENVIVANKEGSSASGDELTVTTEGGEPHVRLTGAPARVIDLKQNTVAGPLITMEPRRGVAHVIGDGTMHVLQEQADGSRPRPLDVIWKKQADMDGPANRIDVLGGVSFKALDADGTINTALGEHARIDLVAKPAPATRPAAVVAARPATRPASGPARGDAMSESMRMDVMKDKDVRTITIETPGGVSQIVSTLADAKGTILRRMALMGPKIIYDIAGTPARPGKTLLVPSAGRMLVSDHLSPDAPKTPLKKDDQGDSHGDTAFKWARQLLYSENEQKAVMTGDVLIVHQADDNKSGKQDPVQINADQVSAFFASEKARQGDPNSAPKGGPAAVAPSGAMQLKRLDADGHVVVTRAQASLMADHIDFDPVTHWMRATGSAHNPARFVDPDPRRSLSGREIQWNTQTWNIKAVGPSVANPK